MSGASHNHQNPTCIGSGYPVDRPRRPSALMLSDEERCRHTFVFGTTGVGKTRLCEQLIVQDLMKGHSVVYIDPKGDQQIFSTIYAVARQVGRLDDLMLVTPVFPQHSVRIDPLAAFFMTDELVGHVIAGVSAGRDPFFRNVAKEITTAVIAAQLLLRGQGNQLAPLNFDAVRRCIRREVMLDTVRELKRLATPEALSVAGMLDDILTSPHEYYAKISSSLRTALMELSAGSIGQIIGQAASNRFMSRLEAGRPVILVVHTGALITREASATLGKVLLSMLQSFVGRVLLSDRRIVTPALAIYLDEAQSVIYPGVDELFAKAGAARVMLTAFAQSVTQLYTAVGELYGRCILDNTNTKIFMRCADAETAQYVVEHFGEQRILQGVFGNGQVTTRETREPLLKTTDLLSLPPRVFYMLGYAGRFIGKTHDAAPEQLRIRFPQANMPGMEG